MMIEIDKMYLPALKTQSDSFFLVSLLITF